MRAADIAECDTFFFYGSLMERFHNFNRYIKKRVTSISVGYCQGYLYNLPMGFPGLIVPQQPCPTLVAGEIMRFNNPAKVMKLLDRLERYIPGNDNKSTYLRRKLNIYHTDLRHPTQLRPLTAWVYIYPEQHLSYEHQREIKIECGHWQAFDGQRCSEKELDTLVTPHDENGNVIVDPLLRRNSNMQQVNTAYPCRQFCKNSINCPWINGDN